VQSWRPQAITILPIAMALHESGIYVSVVNTILVHGYGNDTLRRTMTDKQDAIKQANDGLDRWLKLPKVFP
jgi:transposase